MHLLEWMKIAATMLAGAMVFGLSKRASAECGDTEFCPVDNSCWSDDVGKDVCVDPPPACVAPAEPQFKFLDNKDGDNDGQLVALANRPRACGTLTVNETGYYAIFDLELSESCNRQRDETGYITISNSCNTDGWAQERNAGERYLVLDSDNTAECTGNQANECEAGFTCRDGNNGGTCCVPDQPTFVGTFLLVAGEDNEICLNHWCPEWKQELEDGRDLGFVSSPQESACDGANSIHFRIGAEALACADTQTLRECVFGCSAEGCLDDPCEDAGCPNFCKDGVCLDENPCENSGCEHGCKNGYCLQDSQARGEDNDGDGYGKYADCDDEDNQANSGRQEVCGNDKDDDCDGIVDGIPCINGNMPGVNGPDAGAGTSEPTPPPTKPTADGGGCSAVAAGYSGIFVLFVVLLAVQRRRHRVR